MSRTILVVDDDAEIRELARVILSAGGYVVRTAGSGRDGFEQAASSLPDLILLDVNMPDMDGWEVLRLLKADENLSDLPVVMFTVKSELRDKVHALQDGAHAYVTKPFGAEELLHRVGCVLQSREAHR